MNAFGRFRAQNVDLQTDDNFFYLKYIANNCELAILPKNDVFALAGVPLFFTRGS